MSETVNWSISAQVKSGPSQSASAALNVDAYDKIEAEVAPGGTTTVAVVPAGSTVRFLFIKASAYNTLTYDVTGGETGIVLDAAQLFNGAGAVALLDAVPGSLVFHHNNAAGAATTVEILAGRDAAS